ncbi:MAG: anaerobic ribonucleoside-triphosphate reductase activating protein [Spirochaetales bacterium]|nr:anaerobic ribonucleoside-triphosphate reductase activating protein [Spirochaetales bacterium]
MAIRHLGLLKTTLLDYPGEVAATVFTSGCNLKCPYCHNPELASGDTVGDEISISDFLKFAENRKNVLGGICITGGEPLIHEDLKDLIFEIKKTGLKVKLDTNGTFPDRMKHLDIDYISMDLKTGLEKYPTLLSESQPPNLVKRLKESIHFLKTSGLPHSFRTTAVPGITTDDDMEEILKIIEGEEEFYLSGFRPGHTLDPAFNSITPYSEEWLLKWQKRIEDSGTKCVVRLNLTHG